MVGSKRRCKMVSLSKNTSSSRSFGAFEGGSDGVSTCIVTKVGMMESFFTILGGQ